MTTITVIIASHITNEKRMVYLLDTLLSIIKQKPNKTYKIAIMLSISFDTIELNRYFKENVLKNYLVCLFREFHHFQCFIRDTKTQQMQHINLICKELENQQNQHNWIMFCDDDDLFSETRIKEFSDRIAECSHALVQMQIPPEKFVGLYESNAFGQDHRIQRHEYWCYCVRQQVLQAFFEKLRPYQAVIDNKCCDIVWAEYLRRLSPDQHLFSCIDKTLYHYRRENNADSVTGVIANTQSHKIRKANPPPPDLNGGADLEIYLADWNEYLNHHLDYYLHDTFLRTVIGNSFDDILRAEFLADYPYLHRIDTKHVAALKKEYDYLREMCDAVYEIKI